MDAYEQLKERLRQIQFGIQKSSGDIKEDLQEIEKTVKLMNKYLGESDSEEAKKDAKEVDALYKNLAIQTAKLYLKSQMKRIHLKPVFAESVLESTKNAIRQVRTKMSGLLTAAKGAVRSKSAFMCAKIASMARSVMEQGTKYVAKLHDGFDKAVEKGKSAVKTLAHLRLSVGAVVYDNRKTPDHATAFYESIAKRDVQMAAKDGKSLEETREILKARQKAYGKAAATAIKKEENQELFKANAPAVARA